MLWSLQNTKGVGKQRDVFFSKDTKEFVFTGFRKIKESVILRMGLVTIWMPKRNIKKNGARRWEKGELMQMKSEGNQDPTPCRRVLSKRSGQVETGRRAGLTPQIGVHAIKHCCSLTPLSAVPGDKASMVSSFQKPNQLKPKLLRVCSSPFWSKRGCE